MYSLCMITMNLENITSARFTTKTYFLKLAKSTVSTVYSDKAYLYNLCVICSVEGGELFGRIKAQKQLEEDTAKLYFYQMLKAVAVSSYSLLKVPCMKYEIELDLA